MPARMPHPARRRLGLNIDHVATLRQARRAAYPDPVAAALAGEIAGADQITCHLRGDRRHIQEADVARLRDAVQTCLNLEMAPTDEMVGIATELLGGSGRHRVTIVPERPGEVTTEGGYDVAGHPDEVLRAVEALAGAGIAVSLFIDPEIAQLQAAASLKNAGVDMVELNTARYAEGNRGELGRLGRAAEEAAANDLEVAAGHGLTHHNLPPLVTAVPRIVEYNIGHSIIARAVFVGLDRAVRDIVDLVRR